MFYGLAHCTISVFLCVCECVMVHTYSAYYILNHQTMTTSLLDWGSSDNRLTHKSCTNHCSLTSTDKSDSNNKTTPPVSAALILQILSTRECVCGGV